MSRAVRLKANPAGLIKTQIGTNFYLQQGTTPAAKFYFIMFYRNISLSF